MLVPQGVREISLNKEVGKAKIYLACRTGGLFLLFLINRLFYRLRHTT